jgi:hypothetical protein
MTIDSYVVYFEALLWFHQQNIVTVQISPTVAESLKCTFFTLFVFRNDTKDDVFVHQVSGFTCLQCSLMINLKGSVLLCDIQLS